MRRIVAPYLLLATLIANPPAVFAAATPIATSATSRWSEHHLFHAMYVSSPSPIPLIALHSWVVTVTDTSDAPVPDANLTVTGGMPEHSHGLSTTPQTKAYGDGRYLVEGLKFQMPGLWQVVIAIDAGTLHDSVRFDFELR